MDLMQTIYASLIETESEKKKFFRMKSVLKSLARAKKDFKV
jgi:hypothetical protein